MMPQYTHHELDRDEDILESLQNIPSNFDLALNGGARHYFPPPSTISRHSYPKPDKEAEVSLLDPESLRRTSFSTVSSSTIHSRTTSPFPDAALEGERPRTWRRVLGNFWEKNSGLFLVATSQFFGALMNVTARFLELEGNGMKPFQILFARMSITTVLCCGYMYWKRVPHFPLGAPGIRLLLVARGLSGFFGIFGMYYSLQYLPVADAVVLTFLAPSVASYGCYLFLKEPFPKSAQYASLISLLGVVLIARPVGLFSSSTSSATEGVGESVTGNRTVSVTAMGTFPTPTSAQRASAVGAAMLGVFGAAGAFTSIRWIGSRAHPLISVNYFAVWCTLVSTLVLTLPLPSSIAIEFSLPAGIRQWSLLLFLGLCGFVTQYLLTKGLGQGGRGNSAKATNMIYTNMLFALSLDRVVFGVVPGWWSLGGSVLILGSAVFVAVKKQEVVVGKEGDEENRGGTEEEEMDLLRGEVELHTGDGDGVERRRNNDFTRSD